MTTITIPQKEYQKLIEKALRYEYIHQVMEGDFLASPPTKNIKKIIESFKKTGRYSQKFVESLGKGLRRSSYFNA